MPSFTNTAADLGGAGTERVTNPAESRPVEAAGAPGTVPQSAEREQPIAPGLADGAYDPAVRGQIQRVRLDLLSRETERLEQQLRQLRDQQHEDRQLREELRAQIANLGQRMEHMIEDARAKSASRSDEEAGLRTAVKPLLHEILRMLDDAGNLASDGAARDADTAGSVWSQVDAARGAGRDAASAASGIDAALQSPERIAATPESLAADDADGAPGEATLDGGAGETPDPEAESDRETVSPEAATEVHVGDAAESAPESAAPTAESAAAEDAEPDPDEELRIEIARLLRPKDSKGRYGPLPDFTAAVARPDAARSDAGPTAEPVTEPAPDVAAEEPETESETAAVEPPAALEPVSEAEVPAEDAQEPLVLGTEATPEITPPVGASHVKPAAGRGPRPEEAAPESRKDPAEDATVRRIAGSASVAKRSQRPSWAPRPNPMRASLPKCLTEPWDEAEGESRARKGGARWPFRRTRSGGG